MADALRVNDDCAVYFTDLAVEVRCQFHRFNSGPLAPKAIGFEFRVPRHDQHASMTLIDRRLEEREEVGDIFLSDFGGNYSGKLSTARPARAI